MDYLVGELRAKLNGLPDDYRVRIDIKTRHMHDYIGIEKDISEVRVFQGRQMIVLETEILDLGPT